MRRRLSTIDDLEEHWENFYENPDDGLGKYTAVSVKDDRFEIRCVNANMRPEYMINWVSFLATLLQVSIHEELVFDDKTPLFQQLFNYINNPVLKSYFKKIYVENTSIFNQLRDAIISRNITYVRGVDNNKDMIKSIIYDLWDKHDLSLFLTDEFIENTKLKKFIYTEIFCKNKYSYDSAVYVFKNLKISEDSLIECVYDFFLKNQGKEILDDLMSKHIFPSSKEVSSRLLDYVIENKKYEYINIMYDTYYKIPLEVRLKIIKFWNNIFQTQNEREIKEIFERYVNFKMFILSNEDENGSYIPALMNIGRYHTITDEDLEKTFSILDFDSLLYIYKKYPNHRIFLINRISESFSKIVGHTYNNEITRMFLRFLYEKNQDISKLLSYIIQNNDTKLLKKLYPKIYTDDILLYFINIKDYDTINSILKLYLHKIPKNIRRKITNIGIDLGLAQETFNDLQRNIENLDDFDFTDVNTFTSVNTIDKTLKLLSSKVSFLNPKNEKENEKFWNFIFRFKNPNVLKYILKKYKKFPFKVDIFDTSFFRF